MTLAALCLDFFLLSHAHLAAGLAGQGAAFERRIRGHLDALGLPNTGGFRVFGRRSMSGIYHQIDEQTSCANALVIGEWKAYQGQIPKNDLLRFKAATDDYWLASASRLSTPVIRVFGGTGTVTEAMRVYAAQWGIALVTPRTWPVPALCDQDVVWSPDGVAGPGASDARTLASLVRSLDRVLAPQNDGSWRIPPVASEAEVRARLRVWDHWSERAWGWWDAPKRGRFDSLLDIRVHDFQEVAA